MVGCYPGYNTEQADANQAYVQAELKGPDTWVWLAPEAWAEAPKHIKDKFGIYDQSDEWAWPEDALPAEQINEDDECDAAPAKAKRKPAPLGRGKRLVVKLIRALYGHPDAGTFWEKHCDNRLQEVGFNPIPNWPSCYTHNDLQLFVILGMQTQKIHKDEFKWSMCYRN